MIGDGEVRDLAFAEPLDLHVLAVVPADGHGGVDHLGDQQHVVVELLVQLRLQLLQLRQAVRLLLDLGLHGLGLFQLAGVLFGLAHQHADLLAQLIPVGAELICLRNGSPAPGIQLQDLIHQGSLASWNFFLMFSRTASGFSRMNLISSMVSLSLNVS